MDYAELFKTVKGYVENDFPNTPWTDETGSGTTTYTSTEQINTFIRQAEQRVYNTAQLLVARKQDTLTCTPGDMYVDVPTDWIANFSIAVVDSDGNYQYLLNKDVDFIRQAFPNPTDTGLPTHYAYFDSASFLLGPTPDDDYTLELNYFHYPESIVTAGNSWLGDNFDTVLLYGTLLEAYTFMKGEEDVIKGYQKRYDEAMAMLKQLAEGKNRQDMYRTPQVRYPVG